MSEPKQTEVVQDSGGEDVTLDVRVEGKLPESGPGREAQEIPEIECTITKHREDLDGYKKSFAFPVILRKVDIPPMMEMDRVISLSIDGDHKPFAVLAMSSGESPLMWATLTPDEKALIVSALFDSEMEMYDVWYWCTISRKTYTLKNNAQNHT